MTWTFLLTYLALQLALGVYLSRHIASEDDYFVGWRRLGTFVVAFSLFATWFGAETCLGSSGAIYEQGLSGARADPFGYSLCLLLLGACLFSACSTLRDQTERSQPPMKANWGHNGKTRATPPASTPVSASIGRLVDESRNPLMDHAPRAIRPKKERNAYRSGRGLLHRASSTRRSIL